METQLVTNDFLYGGKRNSFLNIEIDRALNDNLKTLSHIMLRSKRAEAKLRLEDSLFRGLIVPKKFTDPADGLCRKGTLRMTLILDLNANALLTEAARSAGRHRYEEAILRLQAHLDYYEFFVTPEFNKLKI